MNTHTQLVKQPTHTQGVLFATLPRQLPILKSGPEDDPSVMKTKRLYPLIDSPTANMARAAEPALSKDGSLRIH